jgi:hypothetical protein
MMWCVPCGLGAARLGLPRRAHRRRGGGPNEAKLRAGDIVEILDEQSTMFALLYLVEHVSAKSIRFVDPRGALLPNASGAGVSSVESRIAEIEGKYMRATHGSDSWKTYWTGDPGPGCSRSTAGSFPRASRRGARARRVGKANGSGLRPAR